MGASIITGYTGTRHITPEMDGAVYRSIVGEDSYILSDGDKCEGTMPSVNQFTVKSGVVSIQGRQVYVTQETLSIDTCPTGYKRIDLICVRFEHDTTSLIDQASLVVIKGAEVSGGNDPVEPAHNEGVIKDGATVVDFVMYRLDLDGANVEITKAATVQSSLYMSKETQEKWNGITENGANLDQIADYIADHMQVRNALSEITYNTNVLTWQQCVRAQAGNIVSYQCSVQARSAISSNARIASGFTSNAGEYSYSSNCIALDTSRNAYHIYLTNAGDVYCNESIPNNATLRFTLTYIIS